MLRSPPISMWGENIYPNFFLYIQALFTFVNNRDFKRLVYQRGNSICLLGIIHCPINITHKVDRVWFSLRLHGFAIRTTQEPIIIALPLLPYCGNQVLSLKWLLGLDFVSVTPN